MTALALVAAYPGDVTTLVAHVAAAPTRIVIAGEESLDMFTGRFDAR